MIWLKSLLRQASQTLRFWIPAAQPACATTANTKTRIADLKKVTASNGVHLLAEGYVNLATRCQACIRALLAAPPRPVKHTIHFWRGFKSPHGSNRLHTGPTLPVRGRGGGRPFRHKSFHPYHRNWFFYIKPWSSVRLPRTVFLYSSCRINSLYRLYVVFTKLHLLLNAR